MGVLDRFERRIGGLVNGVFARAFKSEVQPVEIAAALQRDCDDRAAVLSKDRSLVPNHFVVELGTHDFDRLIPYAQALGAELSDMVAEHAEEQRYTFVGPVAVTFEEQTDLDTGIFRVRSDVVAHSVAGPSGLAHDDGLPHAVPTPSVLPSGPPPARFEGLPVGPAPVPTPAPTPAPPTPPSRTQAEETTRLARVLPDGRLEVNGHSYSLTGPRTIIGRGVDADLRIDDPGVSRRHAEVQLGSTTARVVDLGSTNGMVVDGRKVLEADLHDGSTILMGSTTVTFRGASGG